MEFLEVSIVSTPAQKYSVMHDDATLDFTLIQYISNILENAFEEWDLNRTTMSFPKERFANVRNEDDCPCKSGREFHSCCSDKKKLKFHILISYFQKLSLLIKKKLVFRIRNKYGVRSRSLGQAHDPFLAHTRHARGIHRYRRRGNFLLAEAFETLIREFTAGCAEGTLAEALAGLHCMYEDL
ncbi:hypothetical protein LNP02_02145 [Klebsiella variicola subsp. variicola]|nr:hypothetical protein [Klebsiella variicola subsp. variicola]